jgi:hypothetical protein
MFRIKDNQVIPVEGAIEQVPELNRLYKRDRTSGKIHFHDYITYIYYAYGKDTIYENLNPEERKEAVVDDKGMKKSAKEIEAITEIQDVIKRYIPMVRTPMERLREALKLRVELYQYELSKRKIDFSNPKSETELLKTANELIDLYDKYEKKINKETTERQRGNASSKLFEDPTIQ